MDYNNLKISRIVDTSGRGGKTLIRVEDFLKTRKPLSVLRE